MYIEPLNGTTVPQHKKYISESAVNCYAASKQQQTDTFEMTASPSFKGGDEELEEKSTVRGIAMGGGALLGGIMLGRALLPKDIIRIDIPRNWFTLG